MGSTGLSFKIAVVNNMIHREIDAGLKSILDQYQDLSNVSPSNVKFLGYLSHKKNIDTAQCDLESFFSLRPSTVSANLRLMEEKGLIIRETNEHDLRRKRIIITDLGKELNEKLFAEVLAVEAHAKEIIGEEAYINLDRSLESLRILLDKD